MLQRASFPAAYALRLGFRPYVFVLVQITWNGVMMSQTPLLASLPLLHLVHPSQQHWLQCQLQPQLDLRLLHLPRLRLPWPLLSPPLWHLRQVPLSR